MNQGYEAVEYALGRTVAPADAPLLAEKFAGFARGEPVNAVLDRIQQTIPLLSSVNRLQLREFLLESNIRTPARGEAVFLRNAYENSFLMIVAGRVRVELGERDVFLDAGQFFGELGLVSGRRRSNSVYPEEPCVLIEVPRRAMLKLIASVESVRREIDGVFLKRAIKRYLAPDLPEPEVDSLVADGVEVRRYAVGEVLFREGDAPDGLYLIRRGSVMVSRTLGGRDVVLAYLSSGNYVGEMGLINDQPRGATVTAASTTEAIVLAPRSFRAVLDRNPQWREQVESVLLARLQSKAAAEASQDAGNIVSFLLKQGVGEATDVLLIDESLCVRCDSCEKACADVHDGTSRLDREAGPTYANIHVPTSCRHCEHPHCMKDCPPDAIHRAPGGEVFVDDSCIGCGNCQRNCPYGVIQMAPADPARRRPSLLSWLFFGLGPEPGREPAPKDKAIPKKAVKCDMCKDVKGGAACVRACPTGAAIRVSPEDFLNVAQGKRG
jgi:CRP-like cAMP-binding protein/ferredoxin-like protein FixX